MVLLSRIVADMHNSSDILLLAGKLLVEHTRNTVNALCDVTLYDRICYLVKNGVYDVSILTKF